MPIVAADPPDGLVIDATGAAHLHGGETAMLANLIERLSTSGVMARAAMAGSWEAAQARAGAARLTIVVSPGRDREALLPLPVAALHLSPDTVDGLRRL